VAFITNGLDPASIGDLTEGQYTTIIGITPTPMGYQGVGHAVSILNGDQNVPALVCIPLTRYTADDMPPDKTAVTLELIQKGFEVSAQK
jgi:ABC-type sugar transport system substrate-binding protein